MQLKWLISTIVTLIIMSSETSFYVNIGPDKNFTSIGQALQEWSAFRAALLEMKKRKPLDLNTQDPHELLIDYLVSNAQQDNFLPLFDEITKKFIVGDSVVQADGTILKGTNFEAYGSGARMAAKQLFEILKQYALLRGVQLKNFPKFTYKPGEFLHRPAKKKSQTIPPLQTALPPAPKKQVIEHYKSPASTRAGGHKKTMVPISRALPNYQNLIMIIDDGNEKNSGSLTFTFIYAVQQKVAPIIVSANIIHNYLNSTSLDSNISYLKESLDSFILSEWIIRQKGRFYLLVPKNIIPLDIQDNIVAISNQLGLYLEPEITGEGVRSEGTTPINAKITNKTTNKEKQTTWLEYLTMDEGDVDFEKEIRPFFREKISPIRLELKRQEVPEEKQSLILFVVGHGETKFKIAGFSVNNFKQFINFFSNSINTSFLYYKTCYGGGQNLETIEKETQKNFNSLRTLNPGFIIAAGSLTEEVAKIERPSVDHLGQLFLPSRDTSSVNTVYGINFELFFSNAQKYLSGRLDEPITKKREPLNILFEFDITEFIFNIPNIFIPGTGFHTVLQDSKLAPITKAFASARQHEINKILASSKSQEEKDQAIEKLTIHLGNKFALLYENNLSVPITTESNVFIPKEESSMYWFKSLQLKSNNGDWFLKTPLVKPKEKSGDETEAIHVEMQLYKMEKSPFVIQVRDLEISDLKQQDDPTSTPVKLNDVIWKPGSYLLFTHQEQEYAINLRDIFREYAFSIDKNQIIFPNSSAFIKYATSQKQLSEDEVLTKLYALYQQPTKTNVDIIIRKLKNHYDKLSPVEKLFKAIKHGHTFMVQELIEEKVNLDIPDSSTTLTPLMTATTLKEEADSLKIIKMLIEAQADLNKQDSFGRTALIIATEEAHAIMVQILINAKANLDLQDMDGSTALILASKSNNTEIAKMLIRAKANLNISDEEEHTTLYYAIRNGNRELVQMLLNAEADLTAKTTHAQTALDMARKTGKTEIISLIEELLQQKH